MNTNKPTAATTAWAARKKELRAQKRLEVESDKAMYARISLETASEELKKLVEASMEVISAACTVPPALLVPPKLLPKCISFVPSKQRYRVRVYFEGESKQLYWGESLEEAEKILADWRAK